MAMTPQGYSTGLLLLPQGYSSIHRARATPPSIEFLPRVTPPCLQDKSQENQNIILSANYVRKKEKWN